MHLERWMVDELVDDDVRVLRSALRAAAADALDVNRAFGLARAAESVEARAAANRELAVILEAEPVASWTEETEAWFDRVLLSAFLLGGAQATAADGLPAREGLREGDVYWVLHRAAEADGRRAARDLAPEDAAALLVTLVALGAEVWDVTAAARQVMKRLVGDAAFARVDERSTPEGQGRG